MTSTPHRTRNRDNPDRCTCPTCRAEAAAYKRYVTRQVAYGRWQPMVDAGPVREHVRTQMAAGLGWMRIATLAGVAHTAVQGVLYGKPSVGQLPSKRIRTETARRLLAVQASMDNLAGMALVNATGTQRRIQAMVSVGWSQREIGARLGIEGTNITRILNHETKVAVKMARRIRDLYVELAYRQPVQATAKQQLQVRKTVALARRKGWVSALAWSDIDDPAESPIVDGPEWSGVDEVAVLQLIAGRPVKVRPEDRKEAARRMRGRGVPAQTIATRLHRSWQWVQQATEGSEQNHAAA